jgi:drug/metabolite transporter (DMT)-like permease
MQLQAVVFGLISALTWGAADFSGGLAVKRSNPYGVVASSHALGLFLVAGLAIGLGEPLPPARDWMIGGAAGVCGGFGLSLLYISLSAGRMGVAAPVSALVAAALPVLVGSLTDGLPGWVTFLGFAFAFAAVWLVSGGTDLTPDAGGLILPLIAGLSFGGFFILLHLASSVSVLWPLVAIRIVSIVSLIGYSLLTRQAWMPLQESLWPIVLAGVLDSAGNAFYALSARMGRLDTAAVLGSLYPGSTVFLAWFFLKERIGPGQWIGILLALAAIVLISL